MWSSIRTRTGVVRILITAVSALVFLSTASPTVSIAGAKVPHSRAKTAIPKQLPTVVQEPTTAEELRQQSEVLARLQVLQFTMEKETIDFNAAIQRRMNQLSAEFADSYKQTQQMQQMLEQANQRIDSTRRWLKFIVILFMLSLGGLLYVALQLPRLQDNSVKWKGRVPDISSDREGIIAWQSGKPANSPTRRLDI
ncbi:MAG: hypothetical protein JO189_13470 [Deltaproteobacteria bacterium]|nr:hypothetical protein [Deltaproteobacteria bacterium]